MRHSLDLDEGIRKAKLKQKALEVQLKVRTGHRGHDLSLGQIPI